MNNRIIETDNNTVEPRKEKITIHIKYDSPLTLKELVEVLDSIKKSINDVNRENGISNNVLGRDYAPEVYGVESGSIILDIIANFVGQLTIGVLSAFIAERLKDLGAKKEKGKIVEGTGYPSMVNTNDDTNTIEITIMKSNHNFFI